MNLKNILILAVPGILTMFCVNAANELPSVDGERCKPVAFAWPRTGKIVIDGRLNEPDWKNAVSFNNFNNPGEASGKRPVKFSCRLLYDEYFIYFGLETKLNGATMIYNKILSQPLSSSANAGESKQDRYTSRYSMEIFLEPPHANSSYFQYVYSMDGYRYDGNAASESPKTWNGTWEAASHISGSTWSMEFKLDVRPMGITNIKEFSEWRYNLVQNRNNVAVATLGDIANFHIVNAFAELIMGNYSSWRDKMLTNTEKSLTTLSSSGDIPALRLKLIRQFLNTQRKNGIASFKSGNEIESDYQQFNYLKEAIRQLENESAYHRLENPKKTEKGGRQ